MIKRYRFPKISLTVIMYDHLKSKRPLFFQASPIEAGARTSTNFGVSVCIVSVGVKPATGSPCNPVQNSTVSTPKVLVEFSKSEWQVRRIKVQVNLCQKLFFLQNMLCTKIVLNIRNNFCTQHVLPRFELEIFMY